jgi:hypothetical protein
MSTWEALIPGRYSENFTYVPLRVLNDWLSELNSHVAGSPREGVNRGKVIAELRGSSPKTDNVIEHTKVIGRDRGYGQDWREHENDQGAGHLEGVVDVPTFGLAKASQGVHVSIEMGTQRGNKF